MRAGRADIDIDMPTSFRPADLFPNWARASMVRNGDLAPHPCGVYPQRVPIDPITKLCAIPHDWAGELGFIKLDFLHLSIYDHFQSREEIERLLEVEPDWNLLLIPSVQTKLFQLAKHGELLSAIRPRSIDELADCLALIRPGKRQLLRLYLAQREAVRRLLYARDEKGYSFKKSHAIAYALVIVLQLHLISAGIL